MSGQKYFKLFFDYKEQLKLLSAQERGELVLALIEYAESGIVPELDGASKMCFSFITAQIDRDNAAYREKCRKNAENIRKRWESSDTNVYDPIPTDTNDTKTKTKTEDIRIKDKDICSPAKPPKHKYGQYKNVLFSDEDLEKLKAEYPSDYQQRIERLSEYIASTGKKYKNHLATIRSWAHKEAPQKKKAWEGAVKL